MSEPTVRAAKVSDEAALLVLAEAEMKAHERLDPRFRLRDRAVDRYAVYLRGRMRDIDSAVFMAEMDGTPVGLAIGSIRKQDSFFEVQRYGYVSDLMVSPDARRLGVGRALYGRVALWFRGLGIEVVRLHIAVQSDEARAFWKSVGAEDFMTEAWIDLAPMRAGAVERAAEPGARDPAGKGDRGEPVRGDDSRDPDGRTERGPGGADAIDLVEGGF